MRYGLHLGNTQFGNPVDRIKQLGNVSSFVALQYQINDLKELLKAIPGSRGMVRWYRPNMLDLEPSSFVYQLYKEVIEPYPDVKEIIIGNELNLDIEQNPVLSPKDTAYKLKFIFDRLRQEFPHIAFHLGAFSPSDGKWTYVDYYLECYKAGVNAHAIDVHCYGTTVGELLRPLIQVNAIWTGELPLDITEWNHGAGNTIDYRAFEPQADEFLRQAAYLVGSANFFMYDWDYKQTGTSVNVRDTEYERILPRLYSGIEGMPRTYNDITLPFSVIPMLTEAHGGPRTETRNIFIHSTRSGKDWPQEQEYKVTVNYFMNPAGNSSHMVIGPNMGQCTRMVHDNDISYHAQENNKWSLSIELAQSTLTTPFTNDQLEMAAIVCAKWCRKYGIAPIRVTNQSMRGIIGHEDSAQGKRDGKSDPGPMFDWNDFIARVRKHYDVPATPKPAVQFDLGEGFRNIIAANNLTPLSNETYDNSGNSFALARDDKYELHVLLYRKYTNEAKFAKWSDFK